MPAISKPAAARPMIMIWRFVFIWKRSPIRKIYLRCAGAAEAKSAAAVELTITVAGSRADVACHAAPRTAPNDVIFAGGRSRRIARGRIGIIGVTVPVDHTFPDIARHIEHTVGARPIRVAAYRRGEYV